MSARARHLALAAFLALHGLAHLASTADLLRRAAEGERATFLAGTWTTGSPEVLRALAAAAAVAAVAFALVAVAVALRHRRWPFALSVVATGSLALVLVSLWDSAVGAVIDLALVAVALRAGRAVPVRGCVDRSGARGALGARPAEPSARRAIRRFTRPPRTAVRVSGRLHGSRRSPARATPGRSLRGRVSEGSGWPEVVVGFSRIDL